METSNKKNKDKVHGWESKALDETLLALKELIDNGTIKEWGLSNESTFGICMFVNACDRLGVPRPVTLQQDYSLLDRRFEAELLEACSHFNITLLAYGPLAGGSLTGKYFKDEAALKKIKLDEVREKSRHKWTPSFQRRYHADKSMEAALEYCKISVKHNLTPTQLALGFCYSRWYKPLVIFGSTTTEQLIENVKSTEVKFTQEILDDIYEVHNKNPNPNSYALFSQTPNPDPKN